MLIDTHCHLNFKAFHNDWQEIAQRAFNTDVKGIINAGSNYDTSVRAIELAQQYALSKLADGKLFAAVGLHPIHVGDEDFNANKYRELVKNSSAIAIGETGLDLFHSPQTLGQQKEVFKDFLTLASEVNKPIIVHNRAAGDEIMKILGEARNLPRGVMHFFSEDWVYAQKLFDLGFYISFTGAITLNNISAHTVEVIKKAPLDRMMIETDAPYVVPRRQKNKDIKRNEPAFVIEVAQRIAEIRSINIDDVARQTIQNAIDLFGLV